MSHDLLIQAAENRLDEVTATYAAVSQLRADASALSHRADVDHFTADLCRKFRMELDAALIHLAARKAQAEVRVIELGGQVAL